MGRWAQYDEDEQRLPEGMSRVGYDADTQQFTYQDADGTYWEGASGARYGSLRRIGTYAAPEDRTNLPDLEAVDDDDPDSPKSTTKQAWRLFAPFLVLVGLVLLLFWHMLRSGNPGSIPTSPIPPAAAIDCVRTPGETSYVAYAIKRGDSCWAIATEHSMSLDELKGVNEGLNCDVLEVGAGVCVPVKDGKRT